MPFDYLKENKRVKQRCKALSIIPTPRLLIVSVKEQELALLHNDQLKYTFSISTSKKPPSCVENSFGTPLGLHALADKIGDGEPEGMVFKGRMPIAHFSEFSQEEQQRNLITTRIIRLRGLEPGYNSGKGCDSYDRYIYIHGTNHEDRIGKPFSGGCIEMYNREMLDLFNIVEKGDLLSIIT
jgi:hypothetical protein